ncbi:MAG: SemiSWEET transporter [Nanoarchaeota archaeon]|nr:SemiSWEET transporter [Nanoarchaeota archaeon]
MNFITLIGTLAGACTTISFLPQVMKTVKTKHTKDLSLGMFILVVVGMALWLFYGILLSDLPIIIANSMTFVLAFIILVYKIIYK